MIRARIAPVWVLQMIDVKYTCENLILNLILIFFNRKNVKFDLV